MESRELRGLSSWWLRYRWRPVHSAPEIEVTPGCHGGSSNEVIGAGVGRNGGDGFGLCVGDRRGQKRLGVQAGRVGVIFCDAIFNVVRLCETFREDWAEEMQAHAISKSAVLIELFLLMPSIIPATSSHPLLAVARDLSHERATRTGPAIFESVT